MAAQKPAFDLPKHYNPAEVEDKWYAAWEENGCFRSVVDPKRDPYTIVIPPPNVTGILHIGHALNETLQDILIRTQRMRGKNALWQPGTDHAGIATQNVVERQLKKEGLHRDDLGRERFIERVWAWKAEYGSTIINQMKKLGNSCDWKRERFTMDEGLSRAVRTVFCQLYREGLIYRGRKLINWCTKCGTALADDEVEHSDDAGHLWHIRYAIKNSTKHLVVATTRPETMLGDTAIAVHPDDERYKDLVGQMVILPIVEREIPVIADSFVDPKFGTGCVKVTPAHDPNDYECGLKHNLEQIIVIGEDGLMTAAAGKYSGLDRFRCREKIVEELASKNLIEKIEDLTHPVGHCYRCGTIIEPYLSEQWFVKMRPLADAALAASRDKQLTFHPARWEKVYFNWLTDVRDWCISRQIWWGHRIPVWHCRQCGETIVEEIDPTSCPKCGGERLEQETDVLDTWFSSALWPFSTLGWPNPSGDKDVAADIDYYYPTSTLVTDRGIIYFWVARMVMMGLHFMKKVPFRDVYIHGTILDENGAKMSKSKGNGIDPLVMIRGGKQTRFGKECTFEGIGADALRYTLCDLTTEGQDIKLSPARFEKGRNFINKVWNASRFVLMSIAGRELSRDAITPERLSFADSWILSRLQAVTEQFNQAFDDFRYSELTSQLYDFIWRDYCDWYLEMVKPCFRESSPAADVSARVLLHVLDHILRLLHPIIPFFTEEVWSNLNAVAPARGLGADPAPAGKFLIRERWPEIDPSLRLPEREEAMAAVQEIVRNVREIRAKYQLPAGAALDLSISAVDEKRAEEIRGCLDIIKSQANAGNVTVGVGLEKPAVAAAKVLAVGQVFVPLAGMMDVEAERARIAKDLANKEDAWQSINQRLRNEGFLNRAPAKVVATERARLEELSRQIADLKALQNDLGKPEGE